MKWILIESSIGANGTTSEHGRSGNLASVLNAARMKRLPVRAVLIAGYMGRPSPLKARAELAAQLASVLNQQKRVRDTFGKCTPMVTVNTK